MLSSTPTTSCAPTRRSATGPGGDAVPRPSSCCTAPRWTTGRGPRRPRPCRRFRVVVPDLRGHGASTGRFDFEAAVQDVLALLDRCPARRSCWSGSASAPTSPRRSSAATRTGCRRSSPPTPPATPPTATRSPRRPPSPPCGCRPCGRATEFARQAARATAPDPQVQSYALDGQRPPVQQRNRRDPLLAGEHGAATEPGYRLPVPALLVHGDHDRIGDIATATRGWAQREPLAEYAVITRAGHASNLDNPEEFTAVLLEFLGRTTSLTARQEPAA